jgi:hypothetical protein
LRVQSPHNLSHVTRCLPSIEGTDSSAEDTILSTRGVQTLGHVVSVARRESHVDFVKYEFAYQGREYVGWSSSSRHIEGSGKYPVTFDPSNPHLSRIDLTRKFDQ